MKRASIFAFRSNRVMALFGAVSLVGVILYYSFMAIDGLGLSEQTVVAKIVGKEYHPAEQTYSRQVIAGRVHTLPQALGERYILKLDFNGQIAEGFTTKEFYDNVEGEEPVQIIYRQRRITNAVEVLEVRQSASVYQK